MASIKLKRGSGVPSGLTYGEPAFDITNSRLYVGITGGSALVGVAGGGVHSFNGLTGAVTGVTTGTANTFGPIQSFTTGISALGGTFSGQLSAQNFRALTIGGDEGGQIDFGLPTTNTSLTGGVSIDVFQNRVRIFESGGTNRGVFIDLTGVSASAGTNLIGGGGGGGAVSSVSGSGNGILVSPTTGAVVIQNTGVHSFNGLTGDVTGVTTGTANTFGPLQSFTNGISSAGGTFTSLVRFSSGICASGGITLASPNLTGTPTTVTPSNPTDNSTQIPTTAWVFTFFNTAVNNNLTFGADIAVNGGDITTSSATATLFNANATTLSIGGAATTTNIGAVASGLTFNIADTSIASGSKQVNIATQITGGATQRIAIGAGSGAIVSSTTGITIGSVTTSVINIPGSGTINASTTNATLNGATFGARVNFGAGICASGGVTLSGQLTGVSASFSGLIISTAGFSGTGITLSGNLSAATKSFLIPHPLQPEKKLQYACLEGPENGVYVRGKLTGTNIIELPDYWTALVHEDSITVQLTSFGEYKNYFVKSIQGNKVTIGPRSKDTDCFYLVQGERKDVPRLTVEY